MPAAIPSADRLAFGITDTARLLGISRAGVYRLLYAGELHAIKVGGLTKVTRAELERFLAEAPPFEAAS